MSHLSQREAAKQWGVARIRIQREIAAGKLTAHDGKLDAADLLRVFGEPRGAGSRTTFEPPRTTETTDPVGFYRHNFELMRADKELMQADIARLKLESEWQRQIIDQLKARAEFAEQAVKMITHQEGRSRPSWWKRTFG